MVNKQDEIVRKTFETTVNNESFDAQSKPNFSKNPITILNEVTKPAKEPEKALEQEAEEGVNIQGNYYYKKH